MFFFLVGISREDNDNFKNHGPEKKNRHLPCFDRGKG